MATFDILMTINIFFSLQGGKSINLGGKFQFLRAINFYHENFNVFFLPCVLFISLIACNKDEKELITNNDSKFRNYLLTRYRQRKRVL